MNSSPLVFAHIGDLHITKAQEQNYIDLLSIIAQMETQIGDQLDFVVLPGDNADNGLPAQYELVTAALKMLSVPVYILAGDHDMEQGSLDNMYQMPLARQLPFSVVHKGNRCLFIDVCGHGSGGPDFRIGHKQFDWLQKELVAANTAGEATLLFMHTFPSDLKEPAERQLLNILLEKHDVLLVNMGHTHYNELANNGQTIFTATRSTGQIEEGPVGYSLTTVHNGVINWRFKLLADPFPVVMITRPVDRRLLTRADQEVEQVYDATAVILGSEKLSTVACNSGTSGWQKMNFCDADNFWKTSIQLHDQPLNELSVKATDITGRPGIWTIYPATKNYKGRAYVRDGSDADTIGAWPENGLFGTQLGPNRNGKHA